MLFRKKYVLLLVLALCGCGFEPLYVEKKHDNMWYYGGDFDTSISQEMAQISIEPISQRFGQIMRNELIDLLTPKGTPKSPKYRLFVHLTEKRISDQALRSDITATRKMVRYKVGYYSGQSVFDDHGAEERRRRRGQNHCQRHCPATRRLFPQRDHQPGKSE